MHEVPFTFEMCEAYAFVVLAGILGSIFLFRMYRPESGERRRGWIGKFEFTAEDLGGFSYWHLALVSVLGLFLELLMIRWISSEIRIFAYFKNFVLIACFLGFGLGCYLSRRRISLVPVFLPLLTLALIVQLPWHSLRLLIADLPTMVGATSDMHLWEVPMIANGWLLMVTLAAALVIIVPIFCLLTFMFIPVGQLVGWYMDNTPRIVFAYTVNVLGSLAGILLYTFLCFLYQPPRTWFLIAGLMTVVLLWGLPRVRWIAAAAFLLLIAVVSLPGVSEGHVYWSPYQKLTVIPQREGSETVSYALNTNDTWYQQIVDLSPKFVESHPAFFRGEPVEWNPYNVPYHFYPQPPSVLVLGSGMGNDVAAALRNGAGRVVAVEIDPLILRLGNKLHFEKPYSSPRVHEVLDDARSYVQNSSDRFDLIVFSLLDSHTTSSSFTNIRIDNYVYTLEALKAAKQILKPDGIFIIKFQVDTPWIAGRLRGTLENVFRQTPVQLSVRSSYGTQGTFFVAGSQARITQAMSRPELSAFVASHGNIEIEDASMTRDDWPYFYQRARGLPLPVLLISAVLILLCSVFLRSTGTTLRSMRAHFFFLGAAFLLLEAQIISKMALLFGTTWVVNSIVIAGLLMLIVAANLVVESNPQFPVAVAYAGIFVTIAASYAVPLDTLFFRSMAAKMLVAILVLCLPVFFAGIVFVRSFARESSPGRALGANLLGGLVGGLLESLSLWTGIRSLVILAGLLYLASWIALRSEQPAEETVTLPRVHENA